MHKVQQRLFEELATEPKGFRYQPALIGAAEESVLVEKMKGLPFAPFDFHGFLGKRRVVSFGWKYSFNGGGLQKAQAVPDFLLPLREAAASFAGLEADALQHVLLTEYAPGAAIGWHKDRPVFGDVIGISLLSPCTFRFRRQTNGRWQRRAILTEPRSAYLLQGAARTDWEHSIPPVSSLRYSVTFRNFRASGTQ